ncbi:MAG: ATPase domain-containing protein [Acidobacteriota bacterium]
MSTTTPDAKMAVAPNAEQPPGIPTRDRMVTGIPGLDHLLHGGLVRGNSLLVEGPPGSGKSTLAVRMIAEGILGCDEPGLIITFEEFPRQLYEESLQAGVDLKALENKGMLRVVWTPPKRILDGFSGKNDFIEKLVEELGARRLLIDSITHFKRVATDELALREILATVLNQLKLRDINAIMVKEIENKDEKHIAFEEYLVDASLRLSDAPDRAGGASKRFIEVRKTRGQPHVSGKHPFSLGKGGAAVYPRLRPQDVAKFFPATERVERSRLSTGVEGLDTMMSGGVLSGTFNLGTGTPGTGKSVLAHHYINAGLTRNETALLVTLRSSPQEVLEQAASVGMDWEPALEDGRLRIQHHSPTGLCVEQLEQELCAELQRFPPDRIVFDSVGDLWVALRDADRVHDHVVVLSRLFKSAGATTFLMQEQRSGDQGRGTDVDDYAALSSCVVQMTMEMNEGRMRRYVGVPKFAGGEHAKDLREYEIDRHGLRVLT